MMTLLMAMGWVLVLGGLFSLGLAVGVTMRDVQHEREAFRRLKR
jgi:hypothetical protein